MAVQERAERQAALVRKLGKLHHLASTKAAPGVFRPRYPVLAPTIGGRRVDDLLKEEGRREAAATLRGRGPVKVLDNI